MRLHALALGIAIGILASNVGAQDAGDLRAAIALRSTHIGALTPLLTPAMASRRLNGAQFGIRYGYLNESNITTQAIAAAAIFTVGLQSSVTLNAGVLDANCVQCSPAMMLGADADMRIADRAGFMGGQLSVAVNGQAGYAQLKPGSDHAMALAVGVPFALSFGGGGSDGLRFAPFVTPSFGVGETSDPCAFGGCSQSGTRFLVAGGIGVWNPMSNISASIGINQTVISGAQPVFGVNVSVGGR
ncbi:MAG TPA: hypothetical protein VJ867_16405 [Gemmatimonadaceae bacterium]|nr:hypothetical protein [Gemmatimonadaceae bacterium]